MFFYIFFYSLIYKTQCCFVQTCANTVFFCDFCVISVISQNVTEVIQHLQQLAPFAQPVLPRGMFQRAQIDNLRSIALVRLNQPRIHAAH